MQEISTKKIVSVGLVQILHLLSYFASNCGRKRVSPHSYDIDFATWVKFAVKNRVMYVILLSIYNFYAIRSTWRCTAVMPLDEVTFMAVE